MDKSKGESISSQVVQKFFWQDVVCRFGVPYEVTMENGKQFDSTDFRRFYFHLGLKLCFASVYHPESNGAVERANGIIFTSIKKNLTGMARGSGLKSYQGSSGPTIQLHQEPQTSHRSGCCIEKKMSSPKRSNWDP